MPELPPLKLPELSRGAGAGEIAGMGMARGATLAPIEVMHRMSEQWFRGATISEKAETLRVWLRNDRASKALLGILEGEMGERVLTISPNKIPPHVMRAAGSPKKQAQFTSILKTLRTIKEGGLGEGERRKLFGLTMKAAKEAGLPDDVQDAMKRLGPKELFRAGPTNVARVYNVATREPGARRLLRWAAKTSSPRTIPADLMSQIDELEGMAKTRLTEEVAAAKGVFGKGKAAVGGMASRVGEAVSPKGLTGAEEGVVGQLGKAGAKGLGKAARLGRKLMGAGTVLTVPILAYEAYDSLVGKSKKARAALEASRRGGTASVSQELMYDILDKRDDLQARRAMLARNPQLMQQVVQAMGGSQAKMLTSSEAGFGIDLGPQGTSPEDMDRMIDQLLGQMRGM